MQGLRCVWRKRGTTEGGVRMRPCDENKPCIYLTYDYGENTVCCWIDFDGTNCPYIKPWGKKKYKRDHESPKEEQDG